MDVNRRKQIRAQLPELNDFGFPDRERRDVWTVPWSPLGLQDGALCLLYWKGRPRAVVADTGSVSAKDVEGYALGPAFEQSPPVIVLSRQGEIQAMELKGSSYALAGRVPLWDDVLKKEPGRVSAAQAEAVVEEVAEYNREWYEHPNSQAIAGAVPRIFPEGTAIVYELLQNAADCGAKRAAFNWKDDTLFFLHDGSWFTENDVEAISFVNVSFKPPDDIGFMGLGFKAVYEVCSRPQIHSEPYHFLFDQAKDGGELFPEWIPADRRAVVHEPFTTLFRMPIQPNKVKELRGELGDFEGRSLLYTGLSELEIDRCGFSCRSLRSGALDSGAAWSVVRLDQSDKDERSYLLLSRSFGPSDEAAEEFAENRDPNTTPDLYRGSAGHREEVTLTVELQGDGSPRRVLGSGNLQVYLPTSIELGCPFDLQGNFIIDASRQQIKSRSGPWNSEYLSLTGTLVADLLSYARNLSQGGSTGWERFYSLIPDDFGFFGDEAEEIFVEQLNQRQLVPVIGSTPNPLFVAPDEARRLAPRVDEAIPAADLASLADIRPLWPDLSATARARLGPHLVTFAVESFLSCLKQPGWETHVSDFARGLDTPQAFGRFARILAFDCLRQGETGWRWRRSRNDYELGLRECRILLTETGSLRAASETPPVRTLPSSEIEFPMQELTDRLALLNGRLLNALRRPTDFDIDERIADKALEELDLLAPVLTPERIAQDLIAVAFRRWPTTTDECLFRYTCFLAEHRHQISRSVLRSIGMKIKIKGGRRRYGDPSEIYFGSKYTRKGEFLESLCEGVDGIDFVAEPYAEQFPDADWRGLLRLVGVTDRPRIRVCSRTYRYWEREDLKRQAGDLAADLPEPRASPLRGRPTRSWVLKDYTLDPPIQRCVEELCSSKPAGWHVRLASFAALIDEDWGRVYQKYLHKDLEYYVYRGSNLVTEPQPALSSMARLLKNRPWVPVKGRDDLSVTPDKVVLPTEENRKVAGETTIFSAHYFSDEGLIDFLDIQRRPPKATPLSRLRYLVSTKHDDVEDFRAAYHAISDDATILDSEVREIFASERLIFVPEPPSYRSRERILYRKRSALSSYFAPIETVYPDLRGFFVNRLGVADEEQFEHHVRFLRDYAWAEKPLLSDEVRTGIEACYRGLLSHFSANPDEKTLGELESLMGDERFVYCTDEGWTQTAASSAMKGPVIYPDIHAHLEQVKQVAPVESHLTRLDRPLGELKPLLRLLRLTPLSRALVEKPDPLAPTKLEDDTLRNRLLKLVAVVGGVWKTLDEDNKGMKRFREHWAMVERRLPAVQLYSAEQLSVAAILQSTKVSESEKRAFLEDAGGELRLYLTGRVLDVYDDLAPQLCSWLRFDLLPDRLRDSVHHLVFGNVARLGAASFETLLKTGLVELDLWDESFVELLGERPSLGPDDGPKHKPGGGRGGGGGGGGGWQETEEMILESLPPFSRESFSAEAENYTPDGWEPPSFPGSRVGGGGGGSSKVNRTRQRAYGKRGEEWVVEWEQAKLRSAGRADLARDVVHRSKLDPSHPYDIESFAKESPHRRILIEVKSTAESDDFDFRLSAAQIREACRSRDPYLVYRVTQVASVHPRLYVYPFEDIWPSAVQMKSGELVVRAPRPAKRED
jgi:hypothetical protein